MSHRNSHISMVLVFGIMAVLTMGARPQKYLVCHKVQPKKLSDKRIPRESPPYKRMTVREPDLEAHLAHGDHMWEEERISDRCQDGVDNDCDGVVDMDEPICPHDVCEESCFYDDWLPCDDACYYEVLAVCTGGDPECFFGGCPPECLELKDACVAECQADYESCVSGCPAAR